ncbi:MAG: hypothetical protein JXB50_15350, partial [Spirochaetes bacterium]|nr:hypothetical protein [Spirochaetota bacterium]
MKKLKLFLSVFLILLFYTLTLFPQEVKDNTTRIELYKSFEPYRIFYDLYNLIYQNKDNNKYVYDTINFIKNKIEADELLLLVDHKSDNKNILAGAYFVADLKGRSKNKPYILFDKSIISIYNYQKSIVYSLMIHEIRHAYDYYTNFGLFSVTDYNLLEKYRFQMDAIYAEALLIQNFLVPNNYSLTDFEKILLESLQKNNLHEYSVVFEMTDMHLIYRIYDFFGNNDSYEKNYKDLIEIGNKLLADFNGINNIDEDWKKYQIYISLYSYLRYLPQVAYNIINSKHKKMEPNEFILEDYSKELALLKGKISETINSYTDFIVAYNKDNIDNVENIYEKFLEESLRYEFKIYNNDCVFFHIIPNDMLKVTEDVRISDFLGFPEKIPKEISKKNKLLIDRAKNLYSEKKYQEAAKLLETVINRESDNLFVINFYAKALYWFDNEKSFTCYKKLVELLDSQKYDEKHLEVKVNEKDLMLVKNEKMLEEIKEIQAELQNINSGKLMIDLWFQEAYWKLGTLYLDRNDFLRGIYEITRSYATSDDNPAVREQAYGYLCESYCILN